MTQLYNKDPNAVKDYVNNWASFLGTDTIATSTWTVPTGITKVSDTNTTTTTTITLSGGTDGQYYTVVNRIVTAGGRTEDETLIFRMLDTQRNYGSVDEVVAFTRHLLDGQTTFNSTTRPTHTDVAQFLRRASGQLNSALAVAGFTVPVTQGDARAAIDDWTIARTVEYIELTQRGVGYSDGEGSRVSAFRNISKSANAFVKENSLGWKRLGAAVGSAASQGLSFTGLDALSQRADPDDTSLAQPVFRRGLFDEPAGSGALSDDEEDEA